MKDLGIPHPWPVDGKEDVTPRRGEQGGNADPAKQRNLAVRKDRLHVWWQLYEAGNGLARSAWCGLADSIIIEQKAADPDISGVRTNLNRNTRVSELISQTPESLCADMPISAPYDLNTPLSEILTESVDSVMQREGCALDEILNSRNRRCLIFGCGTLGKKAVGLFREIGVEPLALADSDPALWGTAHGGLTILSPQEAARQFGAHAVFFVTIWNDRHWFRSTQSRLAGLGCTSVCSYAPIFWRFGSRFMDLLLLNEPPHCVYKQLDQVFAAEKLWADSQSLATYRANLLWRSLGDPSLLPYPPPVNTYFPPDIFSIAPEEVMVDCGAFDGDTIRFTLDLVGARFNAIYAIEADSISTKKLNDYIAKLPDDIRKKIHKIECAVGEARGTIRFVMGGLLTSSAGDIGQEVACLPLDELFENNPVTFIKMDIEGAEFGALQGGRHVLQRDRPVLAICVYHTQDDIWRIPLLIHGFLPEHKLFLRAYEGDGFQTVLYAVPPDRALI